MKRKWPIARVRTVSVDADGMNKAERAYEAHLSTLRLVGEIHGYWFQPFSLRLAPSTFYRTDFLVQNQDGTVDVVDVKGGKRDKARPGEWTYWAEDDARIKLKLAAELYPFRVLVAYQCGSKGPWKHEVIGE